MEWSDIKPEKRFASEISSSLLFIHTSLIQSCERLVQIRGRCSPLVWPVCSFLTSTSLGIKRGIWTFWAKRIGQRNGGWGLRIHDMRCLEWLW